MFDKRGVLEKLHGHGLKLTPQRLAVIDFLASSDSHPSAEQIFERLRRRFPSMSLATVYNILHMLRRLGVIRELKITENRLRFDSGGQTHHHLLCRSCGKILDLTLDMNIASVRIAPHRMESYEIFFYGICADCKRTNKKNIRKKQGE